MTIPLHQQFHSHLQLHEQLIPLHPTNSSELNAGANVAPNFTFIGVTPQMLAQAYNVHQLHGVSGVTGMGLGTGINVCVIVPYSYAKLQADFNVFCSKYGLPATALHITTMFGAPPASDDWASEACLDVQAIHSIAPQANLYVIFAKSDSTVDLFAAIQKANTMAMDVISMSWGSTEFFLETNFESYFNKPSCCYVASSGDDPNVVHYPSCSQHVLCVGGTSLSLVYDDNCNITTRTETTWGDPTINSPPTDGGGNPIGGGCGISLYIPPLNCGIMATNSNRACVDVSFNADPGTGLHIYCSQKNQSSLFAAGGTSLSAPCWAGIIAICDQVCVAKKLPKFTTLNGAPNDFKTFIYSLPTGNAFVTDTTAPPYDASWDGYSYKPLAMHDITSGNDGPDVNTYSSASNGYDLPTGRGSVNVHRLLQNL